MKWILPMAVVSWLLLNPVTLPATPPTEPEPKTPFAAGRIDNIDLSRRLLIINTKKGPATFALTDQTRAYDGKEKIPVSSLKIGDHIKLRFALTNDPIPQVRIIKIALPDIPAPNSPLPSP